MRIISSSLFVAVVLAALPLSAQAPREDCVAQRWLPEACVIALGERCTRPDTGEKVGESDDSRWNHYYRLGIEAIQIKDLEGAEISFCHALAAAASFGPRDMRFAETLDELGLVRFLGGDYDGSEAMQGAAVAEMLLALGPPAEDLCETAGKSCASSVGTYLTRLGWIFDRQGREGELEALLREPHRVLERGYVPADSVRTRLDWLIGRYLLREDFAAADWLTAFRDEAR
ncbi:MAG: hypothetical protein GY719_04030 [bacterium]|nr:hypothetical protein [bacterium]